MRSTISISFEKTSLTEFNAKCELAISKLGKGTKKGTEAACKAIIIASLAQVPRDTDTLASSAFYEVTGTYKIGFSATIGYGGNGDPVNIKSGKRASSYAVKVHEDMTAHHPVGKAKFLEDPVREYAQENFPRTVFKYAQESLADMSL